MLTKTAARRLHCSRNRDWRCPLDGRLLLIGCCWLMVVSCWLSELSCNQLHRTGFILSCSGGQCRNGTTSSRGQAHSCPPSRRSRSAWQSSGTLLRCSHVVSRCCAHKLLPTVAAHRKKAVEMLKAALAEKARAEEKARQEAEADARYAQEM